MSITTLKKAFFAAFVASLLAVPGLVSAQTAKPAPAKPAPKAAPVKPAPKPAPKGITGSDAGAASADASTSTSTSTSDGDDDGGAK